MILHVFVRFGLINRASNTEEKRDIGKKGPLSFPGVPAGRFGYLPTYLNLNPGERWYWSAELLFLDLDTLSD